MTELQFYSIFYYIFLVLAVFVFVSLFFMAAPYGRYAKKGWGFLISNRLGWVIQEAPASILMVVYFVIGAREVTPSLIVLLLIWQTHYFHRSFIYPFTLRGGNPMPVSVVFMAVFYNVVNTYIQGRWLFHFSPDTMYTAAWLTDPRFIIGVIIFFTGFFINKQSDHILRNLRKPGESGYQIPQGGLYTYVTSPNYLGEIITWIGWAVATWSLAGVFFVIWTIANLAPRARSHHKWYKETFPDYPQNRKVLIPFVY